MCVPPPCQHEVVSDIVEITYWIANVLALSSSRSHGIQHWLSTRYFVGKFFNFVNVITVIIIVDCSIDIISWSCHHCKVRIIPMDQLIYIIGASVRLAGWSVHS